MNEMLKDYIETKVYLLKNLVGNTEFRNGEVVIDIDGEKKYIKALSKLENNKYHWGSRTYNKLVKECERLYSGGILNVYIDWD